MLWFFKKMRRCVGLGNYQGADRQKIAVKSGLREENFTINEKNSNSKPVSSNSFFEKLHIKWGNSNRSQIYWKKELKLSTNNKQIELFVGLSDFYRRMIPDFAAKMLPLNDMRNSEFL